MFLHHVSAAWTAVSLSCALTASPQTPAGSGPVSSSRTAAAPHVAVDLIAAPSVDASGTVWLGVRFTLEDRWHIYWQNPGDSGSPPSAQWTAPQSVRVGPFEWPAPERIDVGGLVNYGYHGTVVLPVPATVGAGASAAGAVSASLRWVICHDICIPGRATVSLTLPLTGIDRAQAVSWRAAIDESRARVPRRAPVSWSARARSADGSFSIDVATGRREERGIFFPLDPSQIDDSAPQEVAPTPSGFTLIARKSAQLVKDPKLLRGVLALSGKRAFIIEAPVVR